VLRLPTSDSYVTPKVSRLHDNDDTQTTLGCKPAGYLKSVLCLATGWTTERSRFDTRQSMRISPLVSVSRPAVGPTQPHVQWVPGVLSPGIKRGRSVTLTTHPHLVPRSRMSRCYTPLHPRALVARSVTAYVTLGIVLGAVFSLSVLTEFTW
jgi:hypothetical protein